MTEQPAVPERIYRLLDSNADANEAIELVVSAARQQLRIFDATPRTLRDRGFGSPGRIETLRRMLLASRVHRLRIVLHDARGIESELPRLTQLLAQFSGQIQIQRTVEQAMDARDPMVIADDAHFWRKPHIEHPRSVLNLNNPADTRPFIERYEQIWEKSELAVSGSTLGL